MADFLKVMDKVWEAEHNHNDALVLHYNKKEKNYTFYGIYPYTKLRSWRKIRDIIKRNRSIKVASRKAVKDKQVYQEVLGFYYFNFWKPMQLDYVHSTAKATEIMVFVVNVGTGRKKPIVKAIQRIVGAKVDGIMGRNTLKKLNDFSEIRFDRLFDVFELTWYDKLVERVPRLKWAHRGWKKRAVLA